MSRLRVVAVFSLFLLAGCDPSSVDALTGLLNDDPPAGYARMSGTIKDRQGATISGASVVIPYGQNQAWQGTTDGKGNFKFDVRASDYVGVSPVAVMVLKTGYTTSISYFTSILAGDNLGVAYDQTTAPRPLAANEFVPSGAERLWHVGDADFNNASGSQLQMQTYGLSVGFPVTTWDATLRGKYRTATVTFIARGVDTSRIGTGCPNRLGFYIQNTAFTSYVAPGNSDANGGFSAYSMIVPLPSNFPDGQLVFAYFSGACSSDDYDDQEFGNVMITLNP